MRNRRRPQLASRAPAKPGLFAFGRSGARFSFDLQPALWRADTWLAGFVWVLIFVAYFWAIARLLGLGLMTDEFVHFPRITRLVHGELELWDEYSAMLPGYHAAIAAVLSLIDSDSLVAARLASTVFGLAAIFAFYLLRRRTADRFDPLLVGQFVVLPIVFPYVFLIYTDVASLATVLAACAAAAASRHLWAALLILIAIAIRQNNAIWIAMLVLLALHPISRCQGWLQWIREAIGLAWPYLLPCASFVAFWAWNGSISAPNAQSVLNPDVSLHLGNPLFLLLVMGLLMPLHVAAGLVEFRDRAHLRPWLLAMPPLLFAVFWWSFSADHPLNAPAPGYELFLRARLFTLMRTETWVRVAVGIAIALTTCGLVSTSLRTRGAFWLYPVGLLYLSSLWMIDVRYLMIPAVLWLAWRAPASRRIEWFTLAYWTLLSCWLFSAIAAGLIFP